VSGQTAVATQTAKSVVCQFMPRSLSGEAKLRCKVRHFNSPKRMRSAVFASMAAFWAGQAVLSERDVMG
jgi:hypothetical protein